MIDGSAVNWGRGGGADPPLMMTAATSSFPAATSARGVLGLQGRAATGGVEVPVLVVGVLIVRCGDLWRERRWGVAGLDVAALANGDGGVAGVCRGDRGGDHRHCCNR